MTGGDYRSYRSDPAIERWTTMHATMYQRFRFTPQRTRQVLFWGVALPGALYALAAYSDDRWDLRSKTREDSLLRVPPPTAEGAEKDE